MDHPYRDIFHEMGVERAATTARLKERAVLYSVGRTSALLERTYGSICRQAGLSVASFNLLLLVKYTADPHLRTQRQLSERLIVSPSSMTGLIDRLERKGLVKRLAGRDRREHVLAVTPQGAGLLHRLFPRHLEAAARLCGVLSNGEARTLLQLLKKLRSAAA